MMDGNRKIDIQHPEVWELLVSIEDRQVNYILYTPTVANSLIIAKKELTDSSLQALEDAIYETPVLLDDYRRVKVLVNSSHFLFLPQDTADEDCKILVKETFQADDGDAAVCNLPLNGVKIAYILPPGLQAFIGRTFNYPSIYHHLYPLCEHFKGLNGSNDTSRMFLNLHENEMDTVIYRNGEFLGANSYRFTNTDDATYYALNAWRSHELNQLTDELQLTGERTMMATMTPLLREFIKNVMPAVYPAAAMQMGRNAMQAPLELILLALCE